APPRAGLPPGERSHVPTRPDLSARPAHPAPWVVGRAAPRNPRRPRGPRPPRDRRGDLRHARETGRGARAAAAAPRLGEGVSVRPRSAPETRFLRETGFLPEQALRASPRGAGGRGQGSGGLL